MHLGGSSPVDRSRVEELASQPCAGRFSRRATHRVGAHRPTSRSPPPPFRRRRWSSRRSHSLTSPVGPLRCRCPPPPPPLSPRLGDRGLAGEHRPMSSLPSAWPADDSSPRGRRWRRERRGHWPTMAMVDWRGMGKPTTPLPVGNGGEGGGDIGRRWRWRWWTGGDGETRGRRCGRGGEGDGAWRCALTVGPTVFYPYH